MSNKTMFVPQYDLNVVALQQEDYLLATKTKIAKAIESVAEQAKSDSATELQYAVNKAVGFVNAIKFLKQFDSASPEAMQIVRAILEYSRWFKGTHDKFLRGQTPVTQRLNYVATTQQYLRDTIEWYMGENNFPSAVIEGLLAEFDWGVNNILSKFRCQTDEELEGFRGTRTFNVDKVLALTYIAPSTEPVKVLIRSAAVVLHVQAGTKIGLSDNSVITIDRSRSVGITVSDVANGYIRAVDRVYMHREFIFDDNGRPESRYNANEAFVSGSVFNKVFLIKNNKLNLDPVLENPLKGKVVFIEKGTDRLKDLPYPAAPNSRGRTGLFNVYGNISGLVGPTEASAGIIIQLSDIKSLINFKDDAAFTVEDIHKAIARAEKLEKEKGWEMGVIQTFVPFDVTRQGNEETNRILSTGVVVMAKEPVTRFGMGRVVSKFFQGGVKASTLVEKGWSENYPECALIGANAFKGGFIGLLSAMGHQLDVADFINSDTARGYYNHIQQYLTTVEFLGETLEGMWINVPYRMTNAITAEQYRYASESQDSDYTLLQRVATMSDVQNVPNGLRDNLMDRAVKDVSFNMADTLVSMLTDGTIEAKAPHTRHAVSMFQTMAMMHGYAETTKLIKACIRTMPRGHANKALAVSYITNNCKVVGTASAKVIADLMIKHAIENDREILQDVNTYPKALLDDMLQMFKHKDSPQSSQEWIEVNFKGTEVNVPTHGFLYTSQDGIGTETLFTATGFLKEVLEAVKKSIETVISAAGNVSYVVKESRLDVEGLYLDAKLQSRLLGKNFGYIYTHGSYQLMLPTLDRSLPVHGFQVTDLEMFNHADALYDEDSNTIRVNGVKYPAYFKDAFAGYILSEFSTGYADIDFLMKKAVFMNVETIHIMRNDCDGDLHQITSDPYHMPLFVGPAGEFNGKSFIKYMEKELSGNKLNFNVVAHKNSMYDVQLAILESGTAAANIGKYTATKYTYESLFPSVRSFTNTVGKEVKVTRDFASQAIATIAYLCQSEAMDKVKRDGGTIIENIMDLLHPTKMVRFFDSSESTADQARASYLAKVVKRLESLFKEEGWDVKDTFASEMVEVLHHLATLNTIEMTGATNLFNARCVNEKRFTEISENIFNTTTNCVYSFKGKFKEMEESQDSRSMYYYVMKELVKEFSYN